MGFDLTKKRIAIVSSYDTSCGNASFSDVLIRHINLTSKDWQAFPATLELLLTQNMGSREVAAADRHIREIASQVSDFDAVNIQFEAGLLGLLPTHILKRLNILLSANPNTFVTFHSPRVMTNYSPRKDAIRFAIRGRLIKALKSELTFHRVNFDVRMNRKILAFLKRRKTPVIVHTLRSEMILTSIYDVKKVEVHPIVMSPGNQNAENRDVVLQNLGLDPRKEYVGLFGFISPYKGHLETLMALRHQATSVNLIIAGRIHPQSLGNKDAIKYLARLQKFVASAPELHERVHFVGELDDDSFTSLIAAIDCCILPYHEVGQDGSGIASLCFENGKRIIASHSRAFDELERLVPEFSSLRFDVENSLELSSQLTRALNSQPQKRTSKVYTLESQTSLYLRLAD
jgi:glycosyltransferase involved in cell wall biosynthesis